MLVKLISQNKYFVYSGEGLLMNMRYCYSLVSLTGFSIAIYTLIYIRLYIFICRSIYIRISIVLLRYSTIYFIFCIYYIYKLANFIKIIFSAYSQFKNTFSDVKLYGSISKNVLKSILERRFLGSFWNFWNSNKIWNVWLN